MNLAQRKEFVGLLLNQKRVNYAKEKDTRPRQNREQYERLREQRMSKQKAARIANSGKEASEKGGKSPKYEKWSKKELADKAKAVGIENHSTMNKQELIHALRNN